MVIEFIWLLKWLLKYITNYITSYKSQVPVIHLQKWSPYLRYHTNYIPALVASSQGRFVFKHDYNFKAQFACQVALCLKELVDFRKALLNTTPLYRWSCLERMRLRKRPTSTLAGLERLTRFRKLILWGGPLVAKPIPLPLLPRSRHARESSFRFTLPRALVWSSYHPS